MDYEFEFFRVGEGSKGGDAIVARYGTPGQYQIAIIDGGTQAIGEAIVTHIREQFGEDAVVEHVISTHPDNDHACGLQEIMRELPVRNLWLHGVWHHAQEMLPYFENQELTAQGLATRIKRDYPIIAELIDLAGGQGTSVREPFQGEQIGPFTVLSPTRDAYMGLVPQFRGMPAPNADLLRNAGHWLEQPNIVERAVEGLVGGIAEGIAASVVGRRVMETWDIELLRESGITSAENESSVVLGGTFGDDLVLLTADTGVRGLTTAMDYAAARSVSFQNAKLIQIPHHGSRRNVSPSVLDRLLGLKLPANTQPTKTAVVSAPPDDAKHPRGVVVNAFHRRGFGVVSTKPWRKYRHHNGRMPARDGEEAATYIGFVMEVESYDD